MSDLIEFLKARLDEDERVIRRNLGTAGLGDDGVFPDYQTYSGSDIDAACEYLMHFASPRALAEVASKRAIIELHRPDVEQISMIARFDPLTGRPRPPEYEVTCAICGWASDDPASACVTLRHLATVYRGHPAWREEWAS